MPQVLDASYGAVVGKMLNKATNATLPPGLHLYLMVCKHIRVLYDDTEAFAPPSSLLIDSAGSLDMTKHNRPNNTLE